MERRKFLVGLGGTAIGASAIVGSGAFSSVEANRTVQINTASDSDAYLQLTSPHHLENSEYANEVNGQLKLDFGDNGEGDGVNLDALTYFDDTFRVGNQGTGKIKVWFEINGGDTHEVERPVSLADVLDFYPQGERDNSIVGKDNAHSPGHDGHTAVGSSFEVGVKIDLTGTNLSPDQVLGGDNSITVHAELVDGRY